MKNNSRRIRKPKGIVGKDERFDNSKFYMQYGVDLEKRTISIYEGIDNESAAYAVRGIKKMLEVNSNPDDEESAIDIEVGSYGGDCYYANAIYSAIRQCPVTVRTHGQGPVMSAGLTIYLAGDERYADENVRFMAHSASSRTWGKEFEQEVDIEELKRINSELCELYAGHTNKNKNWWRRKLRTHDYFFGYDDAVEMGIITHEYEEE